MTPDTSDIANIQIGKLSGLLIPFAQDMLEKSESFFPFGGYINMQDEINLSATHDGNEHAQSSEAVDILTNTFKIQAKNKEIKGAGICYGVSIMQPGTDKKIDAISCLLEHEDTKSIVIYVPYTKSPFGKIEYGETIIEDKIPEIFI